MMRDIHTLVPQTNNDNRATVETTALTVVTIEGVLSSCWPELTMVLIF